MSEAKVVLFNEAKVLDLQEVRSNVLRIPEVSRKVREAQAILDRSAIGNFDLSTHIASDDKVFLSNLKLKQVCHSIVQLGLYERMLRFSSEPHLLVGNMSGFTALKVLTGQLSFEDLVLGKEEKIPPAPGGLSAGCDTPLLVGVKLAEYKVFRSAESTLTSVGGFEGRNADQLIKELMSKNPQALVVNIGPGDVICQSVEKGHRFVELIDQDPMLASWFWESSLTAGPGGKKHLALAN